MKGTRHVPIALLIFANLLVGILLAPGYGQGVDEDANVAYGELSMRSYSDPRHPYRDPSREDKGPFYFMAWVSAASMVERTFPTWDPPDARHFVNFATWQLAILSVYLLCLRVAGPPVAFMGSLLFALQPLLFGHAFINQKDSPFMSFFTATVAIGLAAADQIERAGGSPRPSFWKLLSRGSLARSVHEAWSEGSARARRRALVVGCLAIAMAIGLVLLLEPAREAAGNIVEDAYRGRAWAPLNLWFSRVADNAALTPVEAYVARTNHVVNVVATLGAAVVMALLAWATAWFWLALGRKLHVRISPLLVVAAFLLGMAIAIRSVGLLAGLLVAGYAFLRFGPRCLPFLVAYLGVAAPTAYLLWPQLWGSPVDLFRASLVKTLHFPGVQEVLFRGTMYTSDSLPRGFLPWLIASQFTLPAVGLFVAGLVIAISSAIRKGREAGLSWVLILWFLAPVATVVVFRMPIYNNFRQLLFMTPPLFVTAAMAMAGLRRLVRMPSLAIALGICALLPGVVGIVRLYPYEYVYYNELVGGVRGAFGWYELDYWCTSYREAMRIVNGLAPPEAGIAVWGPPDGARPFFREDLNEVEIRSTFRESDLDAFAVIGCSWALINPDFFPDSRVIYEVQRDGVVLAIIKEIAPSAAGPRGHVVEWDVFGFAHSTLGSYERGRTRHAAATEVPPARAAWSDWSAARRW